MIEGAVDILPFVIFCCLGPRSCWSGPASTAIASSVDAETPSDARLDVVGAVGELPVQAVVAANIPTTNRYLIFIRYPSLEPA
jgi:hypothetical protein